MSLLDRLRTIFYSPDMDDAVAESPGTMVVDGAGLLASRATSDAVIGQTLKARYVVQKLLGRGGVGAVYRATDLDVHNRPVVIKVLLETAATHEWLVRKFQHESEAMALIDHPGVVKVLDRGVTGDGRPFFVMEFIRGKSLRTRAATGLTMGEIGSVVRQIGRALEAAHAAGVIHRDLKPENVMLQVHAGGVEQVRLIDFGIAKVEDPQSATETQGPIMAGTLLYMSPEQLEHGTSSPASDVYALGVIAYELLTGQKPFEPPGPNSLMLANKLLNLQLAAAYTPLGELCPDVPEETERLVRAALASNPGDRPSNAREFGEQIAASLMSATTDHDRTPVPLSDAPTVAAAAVTATPSLETPTSHASIGALESVGGAVPLNSAFYVVRAADAEFFEAIARRDSLVLVNGARQMGKTSLLARGLQRARELGALVVVSDFQTFSDAALASPETLYRALAESIAEQLDLDVDLDATFDPKRGSSVCFKRFIQREVFARDGAVLVWGLDEVDRLFSFPYSSEVFGLFRSWHNARAFEPDACWSRLTLAIAYATEAHLFIRDPNQSPFNVGTRLALGDFSREQIEDLNRRHGRPLASPEEIERFQALVGGHPYLVRRGLYVLASSGSGLGQFERDAHSNEGPLSDHLQHLSHAIERDPELVDAVRSMFDGGECRSAESFYLLRAMGAVSGESPREMRPRCGLYEKYLRAGLG